GTALVEQAQEPGDAFGAAPALGPRRALLGPAGEGEVPEPAGRGELDRGPPECDHRAARGPPEPPGGELAGRPEGQAAPPAAAVAPRGVAERAEPVAGLQPLVLRGPRARGQQRRAAQDAEQEIVHIGRLDLAERPRGAGSGAGP